MLLGKIQEQDMKTKRKDFSGDHPASQNSNSPLIAIPFPFTNYHNQDLAFLIILALKIRHLLLSFILSSFLSKLWHALIKVFLKIAPSSLFSDSGHQELLTRFSVPSRWLHCLQPDPDFPLMPPQGTARLTFPQDSLLICLQFFCSFPHSRSKS